MKIDVHRTAEPVDVAVVELSGEIQAGEQGVEQLRSALDELVESGARHVLVDLTDTTFIVSRGFGQMLATMARLRTRGGDLRVAGARGDVLRAAQTVGLDKIVELYATAEDGIASFVTS